MALQRIAIAGIAVVALLLMISGAFYAFHNMVWQYHGAFALGFALLAIPALAKPCKTKFDWLFVAVCAFNVALHSLILAFPRV